MSLIHHAAFVKERGWSLAELTSLLAQPYIAAFTVMGGFALTRTVAGESELLTLAVSPAYQRRGIARDLMAQWINAAQTSADTAFLEVSADNYAAINLYEKHGFANCGLRKAYYSRKDSPSVDALIMNRPLTQG
ncbi:Ribosomal-protein-alanine acetyltransferase [Sulfitobacter guttiformis KCTC 32187]|uniref:Ribosomal-protein-alanine N-acetyltransferase n=2 Tax=Sulfitobacter guttiformis TaxID=74349 RepID=A0A420DU85_9RHOB|nr:Ribosomal-protein-alanine acetyltransferase [Sulfitobacter guttiformis KCTC 32187]RKE97846.1 ribosomal-protein-alanine N-acetyltransferase [Sulfitobacter guttiformis]